MSLSAEEIQSIIVEAITAVERDRGVVYAASTTVPAGSVLELPGVSMDVPWEAVLAFVDREPLANWGHSCRYLLCRPGTGETLSAEARFPPFRQGDRFHWRIAHRAPGVPDSALGVQQS